MKIEEVEKLKPKGASLDSFIRGDCIRLIPDDGSPRSGAVYIVSPAGREKLMAIDLSDGDHRTAGKFVLEPNAKVVIE